MGQQMEMAGSPETAVILDALNATRASARERQDELERKIRDEARKLRQGVADGEPATMLVIPCSYFQAMLCAGHMRPCAT